MVAISTIDLRRGLAFFTLAFLAACGGDNSASAPPAPATAMAATRAVELSDVEIAQLLYSDTQRTPANFYKDVAPSFSGYVATSHLKNTDLVGAAAASQYEVCTNDWAIALNWSDQTAAAMSASTLVETSATSRYHEFSRVRSGTPPGYLRTRVFRCDYLDRSSTDLRLPNGEAGQINIRPLTLADLQQLVEYLWYFTAYNNYGNAVLKSSGSATTSGLQHTLVVARLTGATVTNGCDRVEVVSWTHTVNSQSGALVRDARPLWDYGAKRTAGLVELCNP